LQMQQQQLQAIQQQLQVFFIFKKKKFK
jgi:hypothetical protein